LGIGVAKWICACLLQGSVPGLILAPGTLVGLFAELRRSGEQYYSIEESQYNHIYKKIILKNLIVFHRRFPARRRHTTARVNSAWQSAQRPRPAPRNLSASLGARSLPSAPPPPPPPRTAGRLPSRSGGSSSAGRRRF
jgi:hypothetical protein